MLNLEAREQWNIILVALHSWQVIWHHYRHKRSSLLVDIIGIDKDLTDIRLEVVTNRTND